MTPSDAHRSRNIRLSCLGVAALVLAVVIAAGCSGGHSTSAPSDSSTAPSAPPGTIGNGNQTPDGEPPPAPSAPTTIQDKSMPYVTATTPKLGIKSAEPNTVIAAQLNEPLAAKTANDQTVKVQDSSGNGVAGTVGVDPVGLSIQFTPAAPLTEGETYVVTLGTGITDATGNPLAQPFAWSFEVTPPPDPPPPPPKDLKPPFVTGSAPALGEVISSSDFEKAITLSMSEALAADSVTSQTVHVTDNSKAAVAGSVTLDPSGVIISFAPSAPLHDSEIYTISLDTGIMDIAGNGMTYPYTQNFKTAGVDTIAIAAGTSSFLVLKKNGTVWGWGQNNFGQLGDGTQIDRNKPVRAVIDDVDAISQGNAFSVALKKDGSVWTWGDNRNGQLGDGFTTTRLTPAPVPNLTNVKVISAGSAFALALKDDGTLWAWGHNSAGQIGIGTTTSPQLSPVQVQGISGTIKTITTAGASAAALVQSDPNDSTSTSIWTWGSNFTAQLGDGTTNNRSLPAQVKINDVLLTDIAMIAYGESTMAAITSSGNLYTWGNNRYGQIGNPTLTVGKADSISPTAYLVMDKAKKVFMGPTARSIFVIKEDDTLWGWGEDSFGQLATLVNGNVQKSPLQLGTISNMEAIEGGRQSTLFLRTDKSVFTTGHGVNGQWGNGTADYVSYRPYYLSNVQTPASSSGQLSITGWTGKDDMVIAAKNGTVWAWGSNQYCEMGIASKNGQTQPILAPVQVAPDILKNIVQVSRGGYHVLALDADGYVWAWGDNSYGQLGNNSISTTTSCTPAKVLDATGTGVLSGIGFISTGYLTSFAIQKNQSPSKTTVYSWGINSRGNLGLGFASGPKPLPNAIPTFTALPATVTKLASGGVHMLALTETGDVYGWGYNAYYQAGISESTEDVFTPTQITTASDGPMGKITDICTGAFTGLALRESGTVVAWGNNPSVESIGVATTSDPVSQPTPVENVANAVKIACGGGRSILALTSDGHLWSWGANYIGNLGLGSTVLYGVPKQVPGIDGTGLFGDVQDISYAMAIRIDGTVWQFGYIPDGDPEFVAHLVPVLWP